MPGPKRERIQSFFVGYDLRDFSDVNSEKFDPYLGVDGNAWGPHISFIPPVTVIDQNPDATFNQIEELFSQINSFYVYPVRDARFHLGRTPVTVITGDTLLHYALLGILLDNKFGGPFPDEFTGKGHNSHVSLNGIPPVRRPIRIDAASIFCKALVEGAEEPVKYIHSRTVFGGVSIPRFPSQVESDEMPEF